MLKKASYAVYENKINIIKQGFETGGVDIAGGVAAGMQCMVSWTCTSSAKEGSGVACLTPFGTPSAA